MFAVSSGRLDIVDRLVIHGADINAQDDLDMCPLALACEQGYTEIVDRLLSLRAKIDARNADGLTLLMLACSEDHLDIVKLLLDHGADPLAREYSGTCLKDLICSDEMEDLLQGENNKEKKSTSSDLKKKRSRYPVIKEVFHLSIIKQCTQSHAKRYH